MLGGSTPSSHYSPLLGLVVNFCYGVMKPVLYASRVLILSPGCLSFVRCVDFEFPPFSRMWAAYIELAGIVALGSSQGQDSRESRDNSRTSWGSLEKRGEGNFLLTVSNYSQLLKRSALTNYCIDLLADKDWICP